MSSGVHHSYRFKTFRLDVEDRLLLNDGSEVPLTPKVFDVLVMLVKRAGHLVEKEELMKTVWADSFVEDANLSRAVHTLRRALGENQKDGDKFIATVAKKGYRFVADVVEENIPSEATSTERSSEVRTAEQDKTHEAARTEPSLAQKPQPRYLLMALAAIIFVSLGSYLAVSWADSQQTGRESTSIAILPFRPISTVTRDEDYDLYFANTLISQLSQATSLKVRPFSAIRGFTDVGQDAVSIGKEQKVAFVLESTYVSSGGQLRVTANLVDVATRSVTETFTQDVDGNDLLTAADAISTQIGHKLLSRLKFAPVDASPNRMTENDQAWRHYLHGMRLTNKRILADSDKAITEFESAVKIDPNFADAWVGLSFAHETSYINGGDKIEHCSKGLEAVKRALDLAPNLAEASTILGMNTLSCQGNRQDAAALHRKALDLAPNSPFVRRFYGIYLTNMGKGDESVNELKAAIDLDPTLNWTEKLLGRAMFFAKRYDAAIEQLIKTRELDKNDDEQVLYLFKSFEFNNDTNKAFEWFLEYEALRKASQADLDSFKQIFATAGWNGVLRKRLERAEAVERAGGSNFGEIASLAAQLGDKEKAFAYLEKALPVGQLFMAQILVEPTLDPLRADPRFQGIIDRNWTK